MNSPVPSSSAHGLDEPLPSFVPRPFPPPSLSDVPVEYIVDSLRRLAPRYWNNTATSDCIIIFPLDKRAETVVQDPNIAIHHPADRGKPQFEKLSGAHDPSGLGRRATAPSLTFAPSRLLMRLHIDYLSAHSTLFRALFSGTMALDLINSSSASNPLASETWPQQPRLLPSPPNQPAIFVPIPDPSSFHYLVTWMYFGDTSAIEQALHSHRITWHGIARNVEYLGMPPELKKFLGSWYLKWLGPGRAMPCGGHGGDDSDEEEGGRGRSRERSASSLATPPPTP